jgi:pimeloyl-ACP methyl ester carboxylesterase
MGEFTYEGYRLSYDEYGAGDRPIVLIHGLLMNRHMFERLGPALADRGNRVIAPDLLGHGRSDRPEDLQRYSMPLFAYQVAALLDHLGIESAVIGGTSLGANVTLEAAVRFPERVQGLFVEMPVLDNALSAVAAIFAPIMIALRFGRPVFEAVSRVTSMVPRSHYLVDIGLDMIRQRPGPSISVLEGLLLGESSPRSAERRGIEPPALIVGHPNDPLHPFSDAGMLAGELPNARQIDADSIFEWRLQPDRLTGELAGFLDEVWSQAEEERRPERKARMAGEA